MCITLLNGPRVENVSIIISTAVDLGVSTSGWLLHHCTAGLAKHRRSAFGHGVDVAAKRNAACVIRFSQPIAALAR